MKGSNVNLAMARDLKSNAGDSRADMADFNHAQRQTAEQFEHGKTLLNQKVASVHNAPQDEDLRSLRSEFDYGSKKKFVDVLGNVNRNSHLNQLRMQHAIDKGNTSIGETSYISKGS
jgi:DNA-binding XRE family transcriptional regulator